MEVNYISTKRLVRPWSDWSEEYSPGPNVVV